MKLLPRLMLMITIVVGLTDAILYVHLKQHPEHLTVPYLIAAIAVTLPNRRLRTGRRLEAIAHGQRRYGRRSGRKKTSTGFVAK